VEEVLNGAGVLVAAAMKGVEHSLHSRCSDLLQLLFDEGVQRQAQAALAAKLNNQRVRVGNRQKSLHALLQRWHAGTQNGQHAARPQNLSWSDPTFGCVDMIVSRTMRH
jgi:hypothetical protein